MTGPPNLCGLIRPTAIVWQTSSAAISTSYSCPSMISTDGCACMPGHTACIPQLHNAVVEHHEADCTSFPRVKCGLHGGIVTQNIIAHSFSVLLR